MNADRRNHLQTQAHLRAPVEVGPYTLRPLSATSFILLKETGNRLIAGEGEIDITTAEGLIAAFEFIFVHAAPLADVLRATDFPSLWQARRILDIPDSETFDFGADEVEEACRQARQKRIRDAVLTFAASFPEGIIPECISAIMGEVEIAAAAMSEAEPPEDEEEDDSPNGQRRRGSRAASQQSRPSTTGRKSLSRGNSH